MVMMTNKRFVLCLLVLCTAQGKAQKCDAGDGQCSAPDQEDDVNLLQTRADISSHEQSEVSSKLEKDGKNASSCNQDSARCASGMSRIAKKAEAGEEGCQEKLEAMCSACAEKCPDVSCCANLNDLDNLDCSSCEKEQKCKRFAKYCYTPAAMYCATDNHCKVLKDNGCQDDGDSDGYWYREGSVDSVTEEECKEECLSDPYHENKCKYAVYQPGEDWYGGRKAKCMLFKKCTDYRGTEGVKRFTKSDDAA